jgi:hypothetical protein
MEDIRRKLENIEAKLDSGKIRCGNQLMMEVLRAFYDGFASYPGAIRIIQFQQQDLIDESCPDSLSDLKKKVHHNFLFFPGGFWPKALRVDC